MTSRTEQRWAVAQMNGRVAVDENVALARSLIVEAAARGCDLVALPENCTFMGSERDKASVAEPLDGPAVGALAAQAAQSGIFVLLGSVVERSDDPKRTHATSVLLGPDGEIRATYRKAHLFDVDVAGDRSYRESDGVVPGPAEPVVAEVNGWRLGLTICFDLRFPWLYQALRRAGADVIAVPAAFTVPTGRDHWEILLRARAIETQCYVLAPGQQGGHETGRQTFGRSLIVDPWGTVLATVADGGTLAVAELDPGRPDRIRERMPLRSREGHSGH